MSKLKVFALCLIAAFCSNVLVASDDPVADVMEGCASEIENYCSEVTLGEGRLMACFYAHEDKLSAGCLNALYDGAVALEAAIDAFIYVATACESDIDSLCGDVEPGEGRILNCLSAERDSLSEECTQALQDTEE